MHNFPQKTLGRFGIVKLWPGIQVAEDENIERIKRAAQDLNLECVVIDFRGKLTSPPFTQMTQADLDFVVHLHFETPKAYDIFSFVALWNPEQFYHEWGYRKYAGNLLSHDDFLSCDGLGANNMISRMILLDKTRLRPYFELFHSLSNPILPPAVGEGKLFYTGINWERLGKKPGRHQEILKTLDGQGILKIYGPKLLHNINVWKGYKSYIGEMPFDGVSCIKAIHQAGIGLVLSSDAHKKSQMMSNRLFETIAAGAIAICDENPFISKHMGDTVLYIDTNLQATEVCEQIKKHVDWINQNPEKALNMVKRTQVIFNEKFRLDFSIKKIYSELSERKASLRKLYYPEKDPLVHLYLIMPDYDLEDLKRQLQNIRTQDYANIRPVLLIDASIENEVEIHNQVNACQTPIEIRKISFYDLTPNNVKIRRNRGAVFSDVLTKDLTLNKNDLFCFVAPNETIFSNHISALVGALEKNNENQYASSYALIPERENTRENYRISHKIQGLDYSYLNPPGCAQRIYVWNATQGAVNCILPYLDFLAPIGISEIGSGSISTRATLIIDIYHPYNINPDSKLIDQEKNIFLDQFMPLPSLAKQLFFNQDKVNSEFTNPNYDPDEFTKNIRRLSKKQKRRIFIDLLRNTLIPRAIYNWHRKIKN